MNDENAKDLIFEGLYLASGVKLSDEEKQQLREAYDVIDGFNQRVRRPGVNWEAKPLLAYIPTRKGLRV